jgi:acyl carrier protein
VSKAAKATAPAPEFATEVRKVMAEVLSKRPDAIEPTMALSELVDDSYDLVEMVMTLKDHFQVAVVATEFDRIKTVNDLVAYLHAKVAAKAK